MVTPHFYEDARFCPACRRYVHYLLSPLSAYCSICGEAVQVFSPSDLERFRSTLALEGRARRKPLEDRRVPA